MKRIAIASAALAAALHNPLAAAQDPSPLCDELVWSAIVLEANPDIAKACQGVYEQNGKFFARIDIQLVRVRGNRLTFMPKHRDGTMGAARSVTVPTSWRAEIDGRSYRAGELQPGQELRVYMPEDRFALAVDDGDFSDEEEFLIIEEAEPVAMPKTASPLFNMLYGGLALLVFGLSLTARRRLRS